MGNAWNYKNLSQCLFNRTILYNLKKVYKSASNVSMRNVPVWVHENVAPGSHQGSLQKKTNAFHLGSVVEDIFQTLLKQINSIKKYDQWNTFRRLIAKVNYLLLTKFINTIC